MLCDQGLCCSLTECWGALEFVTDQIVDEKANICADLIYGKVDFCLERLVCFYISI